MKNEDVWGNFLQNISERRAGINHMPALFSILKLWVIIYDKDHSFSAVDSPALEELLMRLGIIVDKKMKADWKTIIHDKKISGSTILFPIIVREGKAKLVTLDMNVLKKF